PVAVGSRFHQVRTVPAYCEETLEVVELEEDRKLAIRGTLNRLPARLEYVLDSTGGPTVLTNEGELSLRAPLALMSPIATRQILQGVAAKLEVVKEILDEKG